MEPEIIKPALYCFDQYQTFDLLYATNIDSSIRQKIAIALKFNWLIYPASPYLPVILIERFVPPSMEVDWAKDWSSLNYEFLKILSRTEITNNFYATGKKWNFENRCDWNRDTQLSISVPQSITLNVPPNAEVTISWLENTHDELNYLEISPNYSQKCLIFNRNNKKIKTGGNSQNITFYTQKWLINSIVIDGNATIEQDTKWLLYNNLEDNLLEIINNLGVGLCQVLKDYEIHYTIDMDLNPFQNDAYKNWYYNAVRFLGEEFKNQRYELLPEWYFFASLVTANNNYWNNGDILEDKGKEITVLWEDNQLSLEIWWLGYKSNSINTTLTIPNAQGLAEDTPNTIYKLDWQFTASDSTAFNLTFYPSWYDYRYNGNLVGQEFYDEGGYEHAYITPQPFLGRTGGDFYRWDDVNNQEYLVQYTLNYLWIFLPSDWIDNHLIQSSESFLYHPKILHFQKGDYIPANADINDYFWGSDNFLEIKINFDLKQENEFIFYEPDILVVENIANQILLGENSSIIGHKIYNGEDWHHKTNFFKSFTVKLYFWSIPPQSVHLLPEHIIIDIVDSLSYAIPESEDYVMPDSIRIKEIHAALEAGKFAFDDNNFNDARVANLGYYIERIARILGISVNSDGSIRSIRQSKYIPQGNIIPAGWPIGQWGRNQGGAFFGQNGGEPEHDKDGMTYEVRSGKFENNIFSGEPENISEGGYVLVENWPQLLHVMLEDFDKALGMQDLGALVTPSADGTNYATFEGLSSILNEILFMLSDISKDTGQTHISSLKNQAILQEVLGVFGTPTQLKSFEVDLGEEKPFPVPYPGFRNDSPSVFDLFLWVLSNLAPLVAKQLTMDFDEQAGEE